MKKSLSTLLLLTGVMLGVASAVSFAEATTTIDCSLPGNAQYCNPVAPQPTTPSPRVCFIFSKNLMKGSQGEDVRNLQKFLNQDTDTRVAVSGVGSLGYEGTYFGPATLRAVIKFQEKYASDVLNPAGLSRGNGYVGALTRAKFAKLCGGVNANITVVTPNGGETLTRGATTNITWTSPNVQYIQAPRFDIYLQKYYPPCPMCGMPEQAPFLIASGVVGNSGSSQYSWVVANIVRDPAFNVEPGPVFAGKYKIKICASGSQTSPTPNCDMSDSEFTIVDSAPTPTTTAPTISQMSPSMGGSGNQVTLYGYNFTPTNNLIAFGDGYAANAVSEPVVDTPTNTSTPTVGQFVTDQYGRQQRKITFTVPFWNIPACSFAQSNPCLTVQGGPTLPNGDYNVKVINTNGTSAASVFRLGAR
jgi:hypothetical protein